MRSITPCLCAEPALPKRQASMIRPHAQDESIHALHAKARADARSKLRVVSFASHACVACVGCLSLAPSHHESNLIRTSDSRNLRPCTLSTNLYIVNPEPESLKPEDYARIR